MNFDHLAINMTDDYVMNSSRYNRRWQRDVKHIFDQIITLCYFEFDEDGDLLADALLDEKPAMYIGLNDWVQFIGLIAWFNDVSLKSFHERVLNRMLVHYFSVLKSEVD